MIYCHLVNAVVAAVLLWRAHSNTAFEVRKGFTITWFYNSG